MICAIVTIAGRGYLAKAGLMEGDISLLPLVDTPEKERAAKALFDWMEPEQVRLITEDEYLKGLEAEECPGFPQKGEGSRNE